jgi:hypothetical protein
MRFIRALATSLAMALIAASPAARGEQRNAGWEKMKSLVGEWQGTYAGKDSVRVTYKLVSVGTALMEAMDMPGETQMITMYTPDGDRIVATHYCAAGNQPRLRASSPAGDVRSLRFDFVDATNLKGADAEIMRGLVITFLDGDHFKEEWTSRSNGKDEMGVVEYARKK